MENKQMKHLLLAVLLLTACRSAQQPGARALTTDERQQFMQCVQTCADRFTSATQPDAAPAAPDLPAPAVDSAQAPTRPETFVALDWDAFPADPGPAYAATGKTLYVAPDGSDGAAGSASSPLKTIGHAVELASAGDKVVVRGGTYREWLIVDKSLTITSAPGQTVWLESTSRGCGARLTADNTVLNGINFRGFNPAVHIGRSDRAQKNIVLSNFAAEAPTGEGFWDGIAANETTTKFATAEGVLIKNVSLKGHALSVTCGNGFCKSWKLENVRVEGLGLADGWGADGIAFENADNLFLTGVEVGNVSSDGIDTKATRVVIHNCYVHNVGNNGIKLWKGGDIINSRVVNGGGEAPIVFAQGPRARVTRSLIAGQPQGGGWSVVYAYGTSAPIEVEFTNNILANTIGGIYAPGSTSKVNISDNIFWKTQSDRIADIAGKRIMLSDGNAAIKARGWGDGNSVADPRLDGNNQATSETPTSAGPTRAKKLARK